MSKITDKLTPNTMKDQYDHQWNVFCKKNHDYGNSFEKSLDTFGLVAGIVRMNDKFERLVSLNDPSKDAQIASESLVDTLEDLSNYAAMAACWLKRKKEQGLLNVNSGMMSADKIKVVPLLGGENEEDRKIAEATKRIDAIIDDIKKKTGGYIDRRIIPKPFNHKPDFEVKLNLEPYLKEHSKKCDEKRLSEAIDLFKYNAMAQAKSQEDIDELFERMLDGSLVSRIVSNGDGTYVAYWEPAKKEEDDNE